MIDAHTDAWSLGHSKRVVVFSATAFATAGLSGAGLTPLPEFGLRIGVGRCDSSAATIYNWADGHQYATPYVKDTAARSTVMMRAALMPLPATSPRAMSRRPFV